MIDEELLNYCEQNSGEEDALLQLIRRQTNLKVLKPRMLSGHLQGKMLELFVKMTGGKNVLEIGTFTGYASIFLARGLASKGKLTTIDVNEELEEMVRGFFNQSGLMDKIDYRIGNALEVIPTLTEPLDFVFIDADKRNYVNYFDLVVDKMKPGGLILADNILWSGKVLAKNRKKLDRDTAAILAYNEKVNADQRVENVILPIRDGIMLARKL
ncbi:O-methyltransferase [Cyclobacterium amurskyense]|jgi:predicted O-methyltransferase YrrM|uniref:O-methyltransferase family 3 n=1 Tax=Cyclobacterium amurskyense TaxID=320787 RepID=A0A0H4PNW1_9BACT|nr:O-methyltransferase [Cyclobacterium amurskyense]AKP49927.1 O-methyltransferase family 3 [Cyclobacterium amurskyense]|tara:strand:- start:519 stop:1157 length:639 start_codon:yes stop_codon:yes gene_type:complete